MIHPTAIVHAGARIDDSSTIGPLCVIDEGVVIGRECVIGPHCHFTGLTEIGSGNRFHAGCVIGDAPQDLKYADEPTGVVIGQNNVFREHVTVHRSNSPEEKTVLGSNGFYMASSHVGHNSVVGDHVIMANGALLGGHVVVGNQAFISGNCLLHQFVRVGELSLMQGGAGISKDLPPFTIARGVNGMCGLNVVGLRRAGFDLNQRTALRRLYHLLFRSDLLLKDALAQAGQPEADSPTGRMIKFVASATRGVCADTGKGS